MAPSLLQPPGSLSPADAFRLSRQAPTFLRSSPSSISASPVGALFSLSESADLWIQYENLLLSCLRTKDDDSAKQCLERLAARFGADNERVMALKGLLKEAISENNADLESILKEYDAVLASDDSNIPITKRRIALLRSMGRDADAISSLLRLLDFSPTDAEAWAELADVYLSQGLYSQAIYALEEVLLMVPNAWNMHARLGEIQYMAATALGAAEGSEQKYLAAALKRFARSIELSDDYLRGYYGLKLVTSKLLRGSSKPNSKQTGSDDLAPPDTATVERLDELATEKLSEIVRRNEAREKKWQGYDQAEIAAARELVSKDRLETKR